MNKPILALMGILLLSLGSAMALFQVDQQKIQLVEKDSNWNAVDGAYGEVILSYLTDSLQNTTMKIPRVRANAWGLEPRTQYTLVYYGSEDKNDVWNYATCITSGKTGLLGNVKMNSGNFDYLSFLGDEQDQKFWIVKSSDVNCKTNRMTAWNPSAYLFETATI
jgi:hypothetical protein